MRRNFFFPIALKISLFFMAVLLVIFLGSGYYIQTQSKQTVDSMINQQFNQALNMAENHFEMLRQMDKTLINTFAKDHEFIEYILASDIKKLSVLIEDKRLDFGCDQIILLDKSANVITQSGSVPFEGSSLQNLQIVEETLSENKHFTSIVRQFDIFVLYASAPVMIDNKQKGMLLMGFSMNNVMMQNIKKDTPMEFTIVGDRAVAATSFKIDGVLMKSLPMPYMDYLWLLKYVDKFYETKIGSEDYYLTARPLKNMDRASTASLMMAYPSAEIQKYEDKLKNSIVIATCLVLLFSIIIIFIFAKKIRNIFNVMISQTQKIKNGEYEQRLALDTNDEFGLLSQNFNAMTDSLQTQRKTIVDYANSLESKVQNRTQELSEQKQSLEYILDRHNSMILTIEDDSVVYANRAFLEFFCINDITTILSVKDLCVLFKVDLASCSKLNSIKEFIVSLFTNGNQIISLYSQDGEYKVFEIDFISINSQKDKEVMIFNDVTRLSNENNRLKNQVIRDPLTGQYNRLKFNKELEKALYTVKRYSESYSLIICDIDNFKKINDIYGHIVGDYALVTLSNIFSARIRPTDIFARWGGEEFVILLPLTPIKEAETLANSLREVLSHYSFEHFGQLTCSFGVTQILKEDTATSALERADDGLYYSKEHGKNMVKIV